jgi:hypothetical protein
MKLQNHLLDKAIEKMVRADVKGLIMNKWGGYINADIQVQDIFLRRPILDVSL